MSVDSPQRMDPGTTPAEHATIRARPLFDPPIVKRAIRDSFAKLNPVTLARNPVIFVVEVVSLVVTIRLVTDIASGGPVAFDVRHLIALLVGIEFREGREKVAAMPEAVLEVDHGVKA